MFAHVALWCRTGFGDVLTVYASRSNAFEPVGTAAPAPGLVAWIQSIGSIPRTEHDRANLVLTQKVTAICGELCRRCPEHARRIEELVWRDCRFRSICEDYGEAIRAAVRWSKDDESDESKTEEYRQIAEDLKQEALDYLRRSGEG